MNKGPYAGAVIVSDVKDNVVYRVDPADFCTSKNTTNCGKPKVFLKKNLQHPYGLAINSQGEIFVAGSTGYSLGNARYVTKFATDGALVGDFTTLGNGEGSAIAFDSQDNLWAVTANAVFKITSSGEKTLITGIPFEGTGIAICKDSATASANASSSHPHFPLELTALWLSLGLYAFGRRKVSKSH